MVCFVTDEGRHLLRGDVLEHVETGGHGALHAVEDLLCLARPHGALQGTAGEIQAALAHPLAGQQVLLKFLQHLVLHLDADALEVGHGPRDLFDLIVGEELHHLAAGLLAEGDEEDRHLLHDRDLCLFLALVGVGIGIGIGIAFICHDVLRLRIYVGFGGAMPLQSIQVLG